MSHAGRPDHADSAQCNSQNRLDCWALPGSQQRLHVPMDHVHADYPLPRKKEASGKLKLHQKPQDTMLSKDLLGSCVSVQGALNECHLKLK